MCKQGACAMHQHGDAPAVFIPSALHRTGTIILEQPAVTVDHTGHVIDPFTRRSSVPRHSVRLRVPLRCLRRAGIGAVPGAAGPAGGGGTAGGALLRCCGGTRRRQVRRWRQASGAARCPAPMRGKEAGDTEAPRRRHRRLRARRAAASDARAVGEAHRGLHAARAAEGVYDDKEAVTRQMVREVREGVHALPEAAPRAERPARRPAAAGVCTAADAVSCWAARRCGGAPRSGTRRRRSAGP